MPYSNMYERLVKDDNDVAGQVAYAVYKKTKQEFIREKQAELGNMTLPDDVFEEFYATQTDYAIKHYKIHAQHILREFLSLSYDDNLAKERDKIDKEYNSQLNKFIEKLSVPSWWYGVSQSLAASFLFIFIGYLILKFNGVWDILLQNLFR